MNRVSLADLRIETDVLKNPHLEANADRHMKNVVCGKTNRKMNHRNEIKSYIVRAGITMQGVVEKLADQYDWSRSVPNLSGKLRRGSLRYGEAVELADVLGYDIVWQKRK